VQTLHSLSKNRLELINSIAPYVEERVLPVLKPVSKCWQPYDMLPKPEDPDFVDQVTRL
jgi:acyl-[acyl-carrier-protein] desaturase